MPQRAYLSVQEILQYSSVVKNQGHNGHFQQLHRNLFPHVDERRIPTMMLVF